MNPNKLHRARTLVLLAIAAGSLLAAGCRRCMLVPWALEVDPTLTGNSDADGVLEPFETVDVEPTWQHQVTEQTCGPSKGCKPINNPQPGDFDCTHGYTETGEPVSFTGPPNGDYSFQDSASPYNPTGHGSYAVYVGASTRPAVHWDATFTEDLSGAGVTLSGTSSPYSYTKAWTLHVGDSFWDVPRSNPFYKKVETLLHHGITNGCAPGAFCPDGILARSEIAVFLARGLAKGGGNIPSSGKVGNMPYSCTPGGVSLFRDVAPTDSFCKHVHYLAAQQVMTACRAFFDCPANVVTRAEMAQDVARAMVAPGGDAAVPESYTDKASGRSYSCDAASPNLYFTDVLPTDSDCKHVHYLWARGVIAGCQAEEFCGGGDVTRGEMAKFLVNALDLKLYGP